MNHNGVLPFPGGARGEEREAADGVERREASPAGVGAGGGVDAGESDVDGGGDTVDEEGAEGSGVGLRAEAP